MNTKALMWAEKFCGKMSHQTTLLPVSEKQTILHGLEIISKVPAVQVHYLRCVCLLNCHAINAWGLLTALSHYLWSSIEVCYMFSVLYMQLRLCARSPTVHNLQWWSYQCPVRQQHELVCSFVQNYPIPIWLYQTLQAEIDALSNWISAHKLQLNCDKYKCMLVTRKRDSTMPTVLLVNGQPLERVHSYKYLLEFY